MDKTDKAWIDGFYEGYKSAKDEPSKIEKWLFAFRNKHQESPKQFKKWLNK